MSRARRIGILALAIAAAVTGAGCASERYVRQTSQILSEDVVALRGDLVRFMEGHDRLALRRINAVVRQREQRDAIEELTRTRLKAPPDATGLHRQALDEARSAITAEQTRAAARAAEREEVRKVYEKLDSGLPGQLDELVNQLNELSATPSYKERATFFSQYLRRLKKSLDEADKADKKP